MKEMPDFFKHLKRDLEEFSDDHSTITVSRRDLKNLLDSYEFLYNKTKKEKE